MRYSAGSTASNGDATSEHQRRIDEIQAQARDETTKARPKLFKPARPKPEPSTDPLEHRIAEELDCIRRHLELLGGTLAGDPILLHRHAAQLQSIDQINQILGHLSQVVAAGQKAMAVDQVTLQDLRARLLRRPLRPLSHQDW
ncbi:MAG: hypothetical protein ACXWUX_05350 [Allosphingosinicella sp.]